MWLVVLGADIVWTVAQDPQYKSEVTLEIRPEQAVIVTQSDPNKTGTGTWEAYFKTQQNNLTSPSLVERCLKILPETIRQEFVSLEDPVAALTKSIDIDDVRSSFVIKVGVVNEDPEKAALIANTLVSLYLEDTNQRMREVKSESVESLSKDTLPGMKKRFDDAQAELKKFQETSGFIDPEEQYKSLCEAWKKVLLAREDVRLRRIFAEAQLGALSKYLSDGTGAELNPDLNQTKVLERLSQDHDRILQLLAAERLRHKDGHPSVLALDAQLSTIKVKMAAAIEGALLSYRTDVNAATAEETSLGEQLASLEAQMAKAGNERTEFRRLDYEVTAAKDVYSSYLKRHGEESATAGSGVSSVRVIDHALPPKKPWRPNIPINLAVGFVAGLLLGWTAVLAADQIDDRLMSAQEVEVFLDLEVLTVVPRLKAAVAEGPSLLGEDGSIVEYEAFRGLRAEILTRLEKIPKANAIAVMSPMPGEGKSTVALNLAKVMAMEGRRVLLIDADMRRPKLKSFAVKQDSPGLDDVLEGKASLDEAAAATSTPGVHVLGLDSGHTAAAEMAASPAFEALLKEAREKWDFVVVDNAPALQASESAMVARRMDAAILVLREKKTGRGLALAARRRLTGMGVHLIGAVLNCASSQTGTYGYGYGYGYGEAPGDRKKKPS